MPSPAKKTAAAKTATPDEELEIPSAEEAEKERVANYHRELQASKDSKPE